MLGFSSVYCNCFEILESFDSSTIIVLINALYFKGQWSQAFNPSDTSKALFYVNPSKNVTVDMMKNINHYPYVDLTQTLDAKCAALPYKV